MAKTRSQSCSEIASRGRVCKFQGSAHVKTTVMYISMCVSMHVCYKLLKSDQTFILAAQYCKCKKWADGGCNTCTVLCPPSCKIFKGKICTLLKFRTQLLWKFCVYLQSYQRHKSGLAKLAPFFIWAIS